MCVLCMGCMHGSEKRDGPSLTGSRSAPVSRQPSLRTLPHSSLGSGETRRPRRTVNTVFVAHLRRRDATTLDRGRPKDADGRLRPRLSDLGIRSDEG